MEHTTEDYRNRLLTVLRKYPGLYDGTLGEVVTTEHVIDVTEGVNK